MWLCAWGCWGSALPLPASRATACNLLSQGKCLGPPRGCRRAVAGQGCRAWVPYLLVSQRRGQGGSRRRAAPHAGSAGAGAAPHSAAAGASPSAAACRGDTWVPCQPPHPVPWPPGPQRPKPYLLLSSCRERRSSRSCRTLSWHSESSSASLRCFPRLWPSSASASRAREQAATSVSCTRASSGDREHEGVTTTPLSQCPPGLSRRMLARPYLGRGGPVGAAGSGFPRAEPGSPCSAAAPAPVSGHRHHWAVLWRGAALSLCPSAPLCRDEQRDVHRPGPAAPARTAALAGQAALQLLPEPVVGADGLLQALAQVADLHQVFLQQVCPCHSQGHSSGQERLCLPLSTAQPCPAAVVALDLLPAPHRQVGCPVLSTMDHTCQLLPTGVPRGQGPIQQLAGRGHVPEATGVGGPGKLSCALQGSVSAERCWGFAALSKGAQWHCGLCWRHGQCHTCTHRTAGRRRTMSREEEWGNKVPPCAFPPLLLCSTVQSGVPITDLLSQSNLFPLRSRGSPRT